MWVLASFLLLLLVASSCSAQYAEDLELTKFPEQGIEPPYIVATRPREDLPTKPPTEKPVDNAADLAIPEECHAYTAKNASIDLQIPIFCCHFSTHECHFGHNGMCKLRWDTGNCDYTVDACHRNQNHWFCTCCASCDGPNAWNECKEKGGRCSRSCYKHEYFAWWDQCAGKECRCCKKRCVQTTCANGRGRCLHSSQSCPRGYYVSSEVCQGLGCKCCVRCKSDFNCHKKKGFCEWTQRKCPIGYTDEKCYCPDQDCRCCRRGWIDHNEDAKPMKSISIKQSQQMEINIPQDGPMPMEPDDEESVLDPEEIEAMEEEDEDGV